MENKESMRYNTNQLVLPESPILKMGRHQQQQESLRSKAAHFISDLTTVFLNPISDKLSIPNPIAKAISPLSDDAIEPDGSQLQLEVEAYSVQKSQSKSMTAEADEDTVNGPDTSSFATFLYSLLASPESGDNTNSETQCMSQLEITELTAYNAKTEGSHGKRFISRGNQSLSSAIYQVAKIGGSRNEGSFRRGNNFGKTTGQDTELGGASVISVQPDKELITLPEASECSLLLSEKTRSSIYVSLPALVQGRKWVLLYSTWRHGISLSTLYRKSILWPGLSLLVVGDFNGAVFGGLVEAPLTPSSKRKYQGSNSTFVFTNVQNRIKVFRTTGANNYFTLCSTDFLALGGGGHFALYLDSDLMNGSSSVSETYGNSCLAHTENFQIKEVELWGFVHASKYEEVVTSTRTEVPGVCRW